MVLFKNGDTKTMLSLDTFKQTYIRMGKILMKWFLTETMNVYNVIVDTKKPFLNGSNLNLFAGFKYDKTAELKEPNEGVEMMLQFIMTEI
jgi:hypothetical protein